LLARGVGAVAVQAGDEGNLLVWPGGECWMPKLPVHSIDATGAGDAFAAGLAVMLAEGRPLHEAGPFANAAAALATTVVGAQAGLPRREAVSRLLNKIA
jgi:ribokinase